MSDSSVFYMFYMLLRQMWLFDIVNRKRNQLRGDNYNLLSINGTSLDDLFGQMTLWCCK